VKLHADRRGPFNTITAYGADYVMVNGERRTTSVIVLRDRIMAWHAADFRQLSEDDFKTLADLDVEIVILGTGATQRFPPRRLTAPLARAGIGLEVMYFQAACRTFNILAAEERKVAAALLFE